MSARKTSQNRPDEMPPPLHAVTDLPAYPNYPAHGPYNGLPEARDARPDVDRAETPSAQQQEDTIPLSRSMAPSSVGGETNIATSEDSQALLTIEQAAARMNMSVRYIRRLVAERRIPFHKLGRAVRLAVADIDAHVDAGRVDPLTPSDVWRAVRSVA